MKSQLHLQFFNLEYLYIRNDCNKCYHYKKLIEGGCLFLDWFDYNENQQLVANDLECLFPSIQNLYDLSISFTLYYDTCVSILQSMRTNEIIYKAMKRRGDQVTYSCGKNALELKILILGWQIRG